MSAPLKLGIAGLGTVGASRRPTDRARARCARGPLRSRDRGRGGQRALAQQEARHRSQEAALGGRSGHARDRSRDRRLRRIDRRRGRSGQEPRSRPRWRPKKSVVTANKALLARHGVTLAAIAEKNHVALNFEAAVGGAIPIVKTLREGLAGNSLARIYGILNGTCNYILTRMEQEKLSFADCLKEAQRLGYAEADPTFDVEGHDTAQKLAILASLAFGTKVDRERGLCRRHFVDRARRPRMGRRARLSRQAARRRGQDRARASSSACIRPWCRRTTPIAQVMGVTNAVTVDADAIAPITLVGPGAGGHGDRLGGRVRYRRHRPRRAHGAVRPAFGAAHHEQEGADAAPRRRLLHPAARRGQAGHRRHHRQAACAAEHLARIDRAASPRRAAAGRR